MSHSNPYQHDVVITGMGIVSSLGQGISNFRDALYLGKSNYSKLTLPILSFPVLGAMISDFSLQSALQTFEITKERQQQLSKLVRSQPLPIQTALIAALEAWQKAYANTHKIDKPRIGLVVAAQNTSSHYQYNLYQSFQNAPDYLTPTYPLNFMDTNFVGVLSEAFDILGEGFTVGGSSASGNVALLRGYQLIRDGWQDACLVVGAMADLSPMELQGFHNLGALGGHHFADQPNKACRPFDAQHEGFIYGQAAGCILLESMTSAKNKPILGYLTGAAMVLDGNHLSNPSAQGEIRSMEKALKEAKINIDDIDYINAHGTSAPLGDKTEVDAIATLFKQHTAHVMINSTKGITGHCLWSAGMIEAIATLIQIQHQFVHPNLNLEKPISEILQFTKKESLSYNIKHALSNSFGFGGINTTLIFSAKPSGKKEGK